MALFNNMPRNGDFEALRNQFEVHFGIEIIMYCRVGIAMQGRTPIDMHRWTVIGVHY